MDIITSTKGYKNNTLEPLTKKLNKHVYSLQKQCSFHIFLIGTGIDPRFRYWDSQEWQQSSPQSPKPYSLSHALCKRKKIFSRCLTSLVMMYHQTNLDCKSFSISEDLVETIVALTLNIAKYFWMLLWLMMMHHHTKFDRSEILSGQTFTEVQNLHCDLDLEYSKATFSQDTPAYEYMHCQTKLVAPKNQQFRTYNRNSHIWLYEPKFSYCDLDLEDRNPFFAYDTLAYNVVSPYWVWLQMVQRCIRYHPN